ncbi:MAG: hypothetical protein IJW30_00980 [Clostridia bacterium]|nr:hypothetical protein [Clostridia bacterium]
MKPQGIRLIANLVLWIGVISGLLGCILALLLANGNPLGMPTEYIPDFVDFLYIGSILLITLAVSIALHAYANAKEKRMRIRACWEEADRLAEDAIEALPEAVEAQDAVEEVADGTAEEVPVMEIAEEAPAEESKKGKLKGLREKLAKKTKMNDKKLAVLGAVGLALIPVAIAGVACGKMASKLNAQKKKAERRQEFYKWLG